MSDSFILLVGGFISAYNSCQKGQSEDMHWNWLNNNWLIGIGTSIVSGLLVAWLAKFFLSKKEDREYAQKIDAANREIIYAIRPGISEGEIPTREVIIAVTNATARRHGVSPAELYSPPELMEELMKEVMDSSFLSSVKKGEYCSRLAHIGVAAEPKTVSGNLTEGVNALLTEKKQKVEERVQITSSLLGIIAAITAAGFSYLAIKDVSVSIILHSIEKVAAVGVAVMFVAALAKVLGRELTGGFLLESRTKSAVVPKAKINLKRSLRDIENKDEPR
jgi:hypothetical protein